MSPASDVLAVLNEAVLIAKLDQEGNVRHINAKFLRLLGSTLQEVVGKPYHLLIKASQLATLWPRLQVALKTKIPWQGELCHEAQNGLAIWTETTLAPGQDPDDPASRYYIIAFDITERKAVEDAFARSQTFWENMMDFAPVGFFTADTTGACHYINRQWAETAGLKLHHALDEGWLQAVHPEDRAELQDAWQRFAQGQQSFEREFRYRHQAGRDVLVQAIAARIEGLNDITLIRVERDITALRDNERLMEHQRLEKFHASRMKSLMDMAGGVAHEINNPLAIIKVQAQQLMRRVHSGRADPDYVEKCAKTLDVTTDRIATIVKSLVSMTTRDDDEQLEWIDPNTILDQTLSVCSARFQASRVELGIHPLATPAAMKCRPASLSQMLLQLLTNALEAVENQENSWVDCRIQIADRDSIAFVVSDNGPGIPDSHLDKIFLPFFTTKSPNMGTGLGLSLALSIAHAHKGQLTYAASEGRTVFTAILPLDPGQA